jgi:putative redox protein
MKTRVTLKEEMHFMGALDGFDIPLDADEKFGGKNRGPKPKGLVLTALAGCTALDVISILRKMRSEPEEFYVEVDGTTEEEIPKAFTGMTITYYFRGGNVTKEKAERAVNLSLENYCGVYATLVKSVPIQHKIVVD